MESPEPSKNNNDSSSASTLNCNAPSSESPQVQESPFLRFVKTLSPIPTKTSHTAQGCLGISSPPLVFKSPHISHRETQLMERPNGSQSLGGAISQSVNEGNRLAEPPVDSRKSNSQQQLQERFIIDTQQVSDSKSDENSQYYSSPSCIDKYLVDPLDVDQMYSSEDVEQQSIDAAETSLSDQTHSKNNILNFDRKDGPGDKAGESLHLPEDSNKVHQEKAADGEEPEKMKWEKNDAEWVSQEPPKLESILAANVFEKQYSQDPRPQEVGCADFNKMIVLTAANILQDDSEATLKYHGIRRRCLQFGDAAAFNALGSNVKLNAASNKMKMVKPSEVVTTLCPQQASGNLPLAGPKPSGIGLHLNSIINAIPTGQAATTSVRLSDGLQGKSTSSIRLQRMENVKRSILSSNFDGQPLVDTRNKSHEIDVTVATDAGNSEEVNQPPGHSKKRKKTSVTDVNGCKRCNCKKSKCVKLYCECFAAGMYCTGLCACQGCLNRPQYAEGIFETKQQIEIRNGNAFTPKIVGGENLTTPSSARHRRGCNCKRSMCVKKYCECFQAKVGCSSGCRCEGCKNGYGKKEDYVAFEHTLGKEMVASKTVDDLHGISPITPSMECSDQGKEAAKSRVFSGNYLPSPESDVNMCASSENLHSSHAHEMLHSTPYDVQIERSNVLHHLTPPTMSNPEQSVMNEWVSIPVSRLPQGCIRQLTGGSLRWRSSPLTPSTGVGQAQYVQWSKSDSTGIAQAQYLQWSKSDITEIGQAQYVQWSNSDSRLFDILENETPDILKEEASPPMTSVKVNSPIRKRVSPPQARYHHLGIGSSSSSSGGLRSGRKFVLQAVPSFPSLSPCVNSKSNDDDEDSDS